MNSVEPLESNTPVSDLSPLAKSSNRDKSYELSEESDEVVEAGIQGSQTMTIGAAAAADVSREKHMRRRSERNSLKMKRIETSESLVNSGNGSGEVKASQKELRRDGRRARHTLTGSEVVTPDAAENQGSESAG